jgi:hypothetical protein
VVFSSSLIIMGNTITHVTILIVLAFVNYEKTTI